MMASGSWMRAWTLRFSCVMLGLAAAALLAGCGAEADTGPGEPPLAVPASAAASTSGRARMPAALRASFLAARQRDGGAAYRFEPAPEGGAAGRNGAHEIEVALADGALGVTRAGRDAWHAGLRWTGLGRGSTLVPVVRPESPADVTENRTSYRRADGSEEQYVNGPLGVEQSFVLPTAPAGDGGEALTVEVTALGDLAPVLVEGGAGVALRDARGATMARYTDLCAFDAGGAELRSWLEVEGGTIRLRVDDDGARYPLRVDPLLWTQQAELSAPGGAASDQFAYSVSVSGGTAIVGAFDPTGPQPAAAYVFVQSGTTWTRQAELTAPSEANGFGTAVWVSGGIAIVGAPNQSDVGAAYVFVQSGTTWTQQAVLTASDGAALDGFGTAVSVSDGVAMVGAPGESSGDFHGAAYMFVESGTTWTQEAELTASDGAPFDSFGDSVSVSGGAAIVGAPGHEVGGNANTGAAYVFARSGTTWTQQAELTAGVGQMFGTSVSVDGATALVGTNDDATSGAAYVFVESGATWTQQAVLTPGDGAPNDYFGYSVSVSGGTAIVGAYAHAHAGAAYVFVQSGTTWTQQAELAASDGVAGDSFGSSVSVNGGTAIVGANMHGEGSDSQAGAAYVFSGPASAGSGDGTGIVFGGCACTTAPGSSPPLGLAALVALLGLTCLRRRRAVRSPGRAPRRHLDSPYILHG
jgi:MYXO-CTERM domain-containing protein